MSRGKEKQPSIDDLSEPSLETAKLKPKEPPSATLIELLGLDDVEEPTRHVQFEQPPGGVDFKVSDLSSSPKIPLPEPPIADSAASSKSNDVSSLFSGLGLDAEESLEIPVHELVAPPHSPPAEGAGARTPTPVAGDKKASTPVPAGKFARGFTAGRVPLDVSEFGDEAPKRTKKKKRQTPAPVRIPRTGTAPMQESQKITRGPRITISARDIILFLLVLVLAAAVWVIWQVFQQYRAERELERLESKRALIEEKKSDALKSKENQKKGVEAQSPR